MTDANYQRWHMERFYPDANYYKAISGVLFDKTTKYQHVEIVEFPTFGKALILDGYIQSATGDEFIYHEQLIQPACVSHGSPKRALILGGGEGATARELLKWHSMESVVMVDIDVELVEACKTHLPEMHQGAFDDPRAELVIGDAIEFLDTCDTKFDIIVCDLSDPVEDSPAADFYTKEYIGKCQRVLETNGKLIIQASSCGIHELTAHARMVNTVKSVFAHAASYGAYVPVFDDLWGFILASDSPIELRPDPDQVDHLLSTSTTGNFVTFDGTALLGLMNPSKHIRDAIANCQQIYTLTDKPEVWND